MRFYGRAAFRPQSSVFGTDLQLRELFERYRTVTSAKVTCDRATGRSRGYGLVEISSEDEARRAIEAVRGTPLQGRPLTVNKAHSRETEHRDRPGDKEFVP
jgi:RNA recognition motif-containing protein